MEIEIWVEHKKYILLSIDTDMVETVWKKLIGRFKVYSTGSEINL